MGPLFKYTGMLEDVSELTGHSSLPLELFPSPAFSWDRTEMLCAEGKACGPGPPGMPLFACLGSRLLAKCQRSSSRKENVTIIPDDLKHHLFSYNVKNE